MRSRSSFSLIELIVVIIIIGILAFSIQFNFFNHNLHAACDQLIKDIKLAQSLALKDDKYQPFPLNNTAVELNRSKFWFKQWWQIRFSRSSKGEYFYEIFSDIPYTSNRQNFDRTAHLPSKKINWDKSILKNPLTNKYMIGICDDTSDNYPKCSEIDKKLNLSKYYGIKKVEFKNFSRTYELLFDNFGNVFLREGDNYSVGTPNDTNPLDKNKRIILTRIAKIRLCLDNPCIYKNDRCIQINITPVGEVFKTNCNF